ncbi:EAL domain-containing protein [Parasphingorhabdus sp.]|uniref:EAL domain-containing protein n=1 Tax=Parasphingorhabdus sp. TaxID=2709688 RepID=UPI003C76CFF6
MKAIFSSFDADAFYQFLAAWILALLAALALSLAGVGNEVEQQLGNLRASLLEKPASGQIVIVEIDAKSLQAIDNWPWPRELYAETVEVLNKAGATQVAFDIDFSSRSTETQDRIFADAIAKSDATIILPTMRQRASTVHAKFVESLPIEILREHAFLASVNVHPDNHGQLNEYSFGTTTGGTARPSLASMMAEVSGDIDQSFAIDQSIDPGTIPRLSFVDLISANGPAVDLSGKKVLIGATAIELGDRYPISRYGILPGVVIQAMATETLIQGTNLRSLGNLPSLFLSAIILLGCILTQKVSSAGMIRVAVGTGAVLLGLVLLAEYLHILTFLNVQAVLFLASYILFQKFLTTTRALDRSRFVNDGSSLPNEAALLKVIAAKQFGYIATARISDFKELLVMTNKDSRRDLFQNIATRLAFLAQDEQIFHLDSDLVAWIVKSDYVDDIPGHFDAATALLQAPVMAEETRIKIGAAFGISGETVDKARIASEQAFAIGKKWAWHNEEVDHAIGQKHNLLMELDRSIDDGDLDVVYQPKWDLSANRLDGAEALVRWSHPERGLISPEIFIPLLERAGRIDQLTFLVLRQALNDLSSWESQRPGLTCSVNISAKLLGDSGFVDQAIAMVNATKIPNEQIVFEVTETATMADPEASLFALNLIQKAGIRVSIDDYGTGQSTISYLQRLPISEIKLDKSFVKTMGTDNANQVIVKSTISMAHDLGLKIVAEGIEDQQCLDLLVKYGCDIGQGWHISKPVTSDVFTAIWLDNKFEEARLSA